jgi:hypothetical protein
VDLSYSSKAATRHLPDLELPGDPLWVIAFGSRTLDIPKIMERMSERGRSLNGLHRPPAVHLCVTLPLSSMKRNSVPSH